MTQIIRSFAGASAVLSLVLAFAVPSLAENNQLEVKCVDPAGNPAAAVKVMLQHIDSAKWKDKKSDAKGLALFNKLDDGIYRVVGRKEGLAPAFNEFILMRGGANQSATLKFESGSPDAKLYFEDRAVAQKAFELMSQGGQALQGGKFAEAVKLIQESVSLNPSNPEAYFHMASAYLQQKLWDEGSAALKKAAEQAGVMKNLPMAKEGPTNPYEQIETLAKVNLTRIPAFRLQTEAEKAAAERKFDDAVVKYKEAIKLQPDDAYLYYALSVAQANARRFDEAVQSIEKALQLKPGDAGYADMKKKLADMKQSEVLVRAQGLLSEGDKLYQEEDFAGALKKYEEARPMVPEKNVPGVLVQIGRTYGRLKQPDLAIQAFRKAIDMAPDNPEYRKALAQYYLNEKKFEEALNVYSDPRASGTAPADQGLYDLGVKLSSTGNAEVAELAFERALKANPNHAEACYELGMLLYYSKKDDKRAQELLSKYLQIGQSKDKINNATAVLVVIKRRLG